MSTATASPSRASKRGWPLERALFLMASLMTALSVVLVVTVSPWFLILTCFVAFNQMLYVVVGACPASLVLRRLGLKGSCE